jgi:hypothetical protein
VLCSLPRYISINRCFTSNLCSQICLANYSGGVAKIRGDGGKSRSSIEMHLFLEEAYGENGVFRGEACLSGGVEVVAHSPKCLTGKWEVVQIRYLFMDYASKETSLKFVYLCVRE